MKGCVRAIAVFCQAEFPNSALEKMGICRSNLFACYRRDARIPTAKNFYAYLFVALRQWELQTPDSKCCRIANSAERGSQNLLFFNVHLELFKNADAFFDVRVSAE